MAPTFAFLPLSFLIPRESIPTPNTTNADAAATPSSLSLSWVAAPVILGALALVFFIVQCMFPNLGPAIAPALMRRIRRRQHDSKVGIVPVPEALDIEHTQALPVNNRPGDDRSSAYTQPDRPISTVTHAGRSALLLTQLGQNSSARGDVTGVDGEETSSTLHPTISQHHRDEVPHHSRQVSTYPAFDVRKQNNLNREEPFTGTTPDQEPLPPNAPRNEGSLTSGPLNIMDSVKEGIGEPTTPMAEVSQPPNAKSLHPRVSHDMRAPTTNIEACVSKEVDNTQMISRPLMAVVSSPPSDDWACESLLPTQPQSVARRPKWLSPWIAAVNLLSNLSRLGRS